AVVYLFLPLAHALARVASWVVLHQGATIAYWRGDVAKLVDDLAEVKPTHFPSVPRVFEKINTKAVAAAADGGSIKKALFDWAVATGRRARAARRAGTLSSGLRLQHEIADRLVLSKVRGLFGGHLKLGLVGAAPIGREVLEFFDACGLVVLEGFGLTETCAAATLNTVGAFRFGTVGRALPGTEVAISDDGEVLLRGANVFSGYYRNEEATQETFRDGWFLTGDLGELEDGYLRITGRRKDLIITSSGKNVTPTLIESALRETRWISQALVYGDRHSYLVALLTLDAEEAPALAEHLGIPFDVPAMAQDPRVHEALRESVDEVNERFARIEQVKRFGILDHDLTQGGGALTPTLKVKRDVVYSRYRDEFEKLYA
ncbi:MAG TPA: AMP-binding protein, partial [Solirubrobacteraceae bacterium]|nr:AMP-binding protein [Solirubrobacteraceae bacterium]